MGTFITRKFRIRSQVCELYSFRSSEEGASLSGPSDPALMADGNCVVVGWS
jgi:hypothetical protein